MFATRFDLAACQAIADALTALPPTVRRDILTGPPRAQARALTEATAIIYLRLADQPTYHDQQLPLPLPCASRLDV